MINKNKIKKVFLYDQDGKLMIMSRSVTFPRDFFRLRNKDLVMLKGTNFPVLPKDSYVEVIFEYLTGIRMKYVTTIDISTEKQINFHVGDGIEVEERRRFYKVEIEIDGVAQFYMRDDEIYNFAPPISTKFKNINIGGVFLLPMPELELEKGDLIMFNFMNGEMNLLSEVLRVQVGDDGVTGYGCRFTSPTPQQEERMARFLFECQALEREQAKKTILFSE